MGILSKNSPWEFHEVLEARQPLLVDLFGHRSEHIHAGIRPAAAVRIGCVGSTRIRIAKVASGLLAGERRRASRRRTHRGKILDSISRNRLHQRLTALGESPLGGFGGSHVLQITQRARFIKTQEELCAVVARLRGFCVFLFATKEAANKASHS